MCQLGTILVVMENNNGKAVGSQGPVAGKVAPPTRDEVKAWVRRDALAALHFINILVKDPELLDDLSEEIYQRAQARDLDDHKLRDESVSNGVH